MMNRKQFKLLCKLNDTSLFVSKDTNKDVKADYYNWGYTNDNPQVVKMMNISKENELIKKNLDVFYTCPIRIISQDTYFYVNFDPNVLTEYERFRQQRLFNILTIIFIVIGTVFSAISYFI